MRSFQVSMTRWVVRRLRSGASSSCGSVRRRFGLLSRTWLWCSLLLRYAPTSRQMSKLHGGSGADRPASMPGVRRSTGSALQCLAAVGRIMRSCKRAIQSNELCNGVIAFTAVVVAHLHSYGHGLYSTPRAKEYSCEFCLRAFAK